MATRKKKNNIGSFGHPIYGKGFAKYGEMRPNGSSEIPNDLEEAAEKHSTDYDSTIRCVLESSNQKTIWKREHKETFIAGAKWQKEQDDKELSEKIAAAYQLGVKDKEQMMKEAVEVMVTTNLANRPVIYLDQLEGLKYGDKVRIIIVKE